MALESNSPRQDNRDRESQRDDRNRPRERTKERNFDRERRSRSPDRRNNRNNDGDSSDAYVSSRSHRDREREDRYHVRRHRDRSSSQSRSSRLRRDEDRSLRHRSNRDEEQRSSRIKESRDDRDRRNGRDRLASRSSSRKRQRRDRTPDLANIVPILERKRRMSQWDIRPPGYDNISSEQAKMSGQFPLPGAPRIEPDASKAPQPSENASQAVAPPPPVVKLNVSRQAKRLILRNLPDTMVADELRSFLNLQLNGLNVVENTNPCISAQLAPNRQFAIAEFSSANDTTIALALDGISMDGSTNAGLKIERPTDYIVPTPTATGFQPGVISKVVSDSPDTLSVTNIPLRLNEDQVLELLKTFGELKSFVMVSDRHTDEYRGIAFCEFHESKTTDVAIEGLDKMEMGESCLKVKRACLGHPPVAGIELGPSAMLMLTNTRTSNVQTSSVLMLLNMITADELHASDNIAEISDDVLNECSKFGNVVQVKIPQPSDHKQSSGVGKVYVKFTNAIDCKNALQNLAGRRFSSRTVITAYFPEENFDVNYW